MGYWIVTASTHDKVKWDDITAIKDQSIWSAELGYLTMEIGFQLETESDGGRIHQTIVENSNPKVKESKFIQLSVPKFQIRKPQQNVT